MSVHLPITIGENVWICGSVTIVPRVTLGDKTIIGAGSVVKRHTCKCYCRRCPCKVIRPITAKDFMGWKM
ncbi:hypothetical protein [Metabacillus sediminilitoris]|uniref:hypothetical protein n=1 Tax=Metabacillus sediminilitoris TaxID=2567941 RepID=UPI001B3B248E